MPTNDVDLQMWLNAAWADVPLYSASGVTITRGIDPDGSWPRPSKIECEINNDSLNYDPSRPESTLYGVAGRNTKVRVFSNANERVWAEASSWSPERTSEHVPGAARGRSWTKLTAEGILRRIGLWSEPLRSPMYRTIAGRSTSVGHWSLEDDDGALVLANSLPTGRSGTFKGGAALGESETPLGAAQTVKTTTGSQLAGQFVSASSTAGWQIAFSFKLNALPPVGPYTTLFAWTTSQGWTWAIQADNGAYNFLVTDSSGATVFSGNVLFGAGAEPNQWVTFRVRVAQSGGNVDMQPAWYAQGMSGPYGISYLFAGTIGRLVRWWQPGSAIVDGAHFVHVFGVTTVADSLVGVTAQQVFNGYLGETAAARFMRLCAELGVTGYLLGAAADTQAMGPQRAATFLTLLGEIRETDDCRIDDERFDLALTMRTRRHLYNQTPALALTYPGQVAVPFVRVLDDQATRNRVTVKNAAGGEYTAALLSGPMSVLPPPAGVGEVKASVDVNVSNSAVQLPGLATWHLAKGTIERPRYAEVTVDLLANPGLAAAAVAVREGDLITVTAAEPDVIYLLVVGIIEKVGTAPWTIAFQVERYEPYRVGVYDDGVWRWDTGTTTLAAGATAVAGSLSLTTVDRNDCLTTAAGSLPFDLTVAGERVRVTAMTAPAGTGPFTQTATVTRSINGVVKAQTAGATVRVFESRRWGL